MPLRVTIFLGHQQLTIKNLITKEVERNTLNKKQIVIFTHELDDVFAGTTISSRFWNSLF